MISVMLLWLFTLIPLLANQTFQTTWTVSSGTCFVWRIQYEDTLAISDTTSHILLLSLDDLTQDNNCSHLFQEKRFSPLLPQISASCGLLAEPELFKQMASSAFKEGIFGISSKQVQHEFVKVSSCSYPYITLPVMQIFKSKRFRYPEKEKRPSQSPVTIL